MKENDSLFERLHPQLQPPSAFSTSLKDIAGTDTHASPMSPPMSQRHHRDSSPGLDNHHDGSSDDEIQHESFARSSQSEVECLRPWTEAVNSIPLPEKAITLQKKCDRNYKKRREDIKNKDSIIKQRLEKAMSDKLREMGNKDYEKAGRHGSDLFTKVPPKGYRAILGWMGNIPIGDYAVRFNNLIGCLIRDPHHINIAHNFDEQQWNGIKKIWERLMNHYCLEDNPDSWDYVMSRASKMLRGWRSRLKSQYFTDITIDWKRIHQLDKRVPPYNWMTLIIEWEGEKKDKCSIASANRGAKLYDHFLGATPYARIEHKYLRENPDALTMPPTLLARSAYTPPEGYDKVEKMTKIKDMHEALEASQDFVLSQSQSIENTPTDPNRMTREQWREIVDGVYGSKPIKKGRVPLSSAKVRIVSTSRNIQNDSSATSNRPSVTSYVVAKIGQYLMDNVQPSMFFQFIPIITRELGGAQSTWDVVQRLSDCPSLKKILPESIYLEIFKLAFAEHEAHGGGETGGGIVGSSSTIRRSNADDADNRDADDDEE